MPKLAGGDSSQRLALVLDCRQHEADVLTEDGTTKEELVKLLSGLWSEKKSRGPVFRECRHMERVLEQEKQWQNRDMANLPELEDHKITDFARQLVSISKAAPLRMRDAERQIWKILESALLVSEYTDKIDVLHRGNKTQTIVSEIQNLCFIISGLVVSHSYERAQKILGASLAENEEIYKRVFELGRRAKIINPHQMRSTYGKMMWMLMDAEREEIKRSVTFACVQPQITTVYTFLISKNRDEAEMFLKDPSLEAAIHEIDPVGKSREQIAAAKKKKEDALEVMKSRYGRKNDAAEMQVGDLLKSYTEEGDPHGERMSPSDVETIVRSLQDYNTWQAATATPVERMLEFLEIFFRPDKPSGADGDLTIRSSSEGSCLSHNHPTHYMFVSQSLTLWKYIMYRMLQLWHAADTDMLESRYRLVDTGQGLNRMQPAPNVSRHMSAILSACQKEVAKKGQSWVGLSVVHLGDRDVPNALFFIDKYTQVPRILNPLINVIDKLPVIYRENARMKEYIDNFGGYEAAQKMILRDFFRHGFDGSGDDGGSCVDGRLTSSWNWCSQIEKKPYFPLFLLCGWQGFDG